MIEPINISNSSKAQPVRIDEAKAVFLNTARDTAEKEKIPFSMKVFKKIDKFYDLGSTSSLDLNDMTKEESTAFWQVLAKLLKNGVVGYHYYEIDGKIEKHYDVNELANRRLADAKIVTNYIDKYV